MFAPFLGNKVIPRALCVAFDDVLEDWYGKPRRLFCCWLELLLFRLFYDKYDYCYLESIPAALVMGLLKLERFRVSEGVYNAPALLSELFSF